MKYISLVVSVHVIIKVSINEGRWIGIQLFHLQTAGRDEYPYHGRSFAYTLLTSKSVFLDENIVS